LLEGLPTDRRVAEEEQDTTNALAHVDVTGEVTVAIADEM
jgi:hypothetical protein